MSVPNKIGLTVFADGALADGHAFIEVFHDWIRRKELDELMIDVADYGHVRGGPSVYFCGHASDYAIVLSERPAILYRRKRAGDGAPIEDGLRRVAGVIAKLGAEPKLRSSPSEPGGLAAKFDGSRFVLGFYDRLAAPNTDEGAAAMIAAVKVPIEAKLGPVEITRAKNDPRGVLKLEVKPANTISWSKLASG